ncbi:MAG: sulfotransferase family protein, partial [Acidimicrobiales bacterium]
QALPYFPRMFDIGTHHAHEEINLLAIDFSTMYFDTLAPMPTWREHYLAHDQTPHYDYLRTVLKALQFLRGGTRWVLKSPQHLEQFGPLMSTFPDATVVVTHRDPASVVASMATMIAYTARMHLDPVDPVGIGHYWADLLSVMLNSCLANRDVLPSDRSIDVRFDQFMADDRATVERIYDLAAQPFDDSARSAVAAYLAGHQRNRHGALIYDLADFDLDADSIRAGLADYIERFAISIEPVGP